MSWFERKRDEIQQFDLSALNAIGWVLFLSTVALIVAGVIVAITAMDDPQGAAAGQEPPKPWWTKPLAIGMILFGVAWFQIGKYLLGLVGLSVYRKNYVAPSK